MLTKTIHNFIKTITLLTFFFLKVNSFLQSLNSLSNSLDNRIRIANNTLDRIFENNNQRADDLINIHQNFIQPKSFETMFSEILNGFSIEQNPKNKTDSVIQNQQPSLNYSSRRIFDNNTEPNESKKSEVILKNDKTNKANELLEDILRRNKGNDFEIMRKNDRMHKINSFSNNWASASIKNIRNRSTNKKKPNSVIFNSSNDNKEREYISETSDKEIKKMDSEKIVEKPNPELKDYENNVNPKLLKSESKIFFLSPNSKRIKIKERSNNLNYLFIPKLKNVQFKDSSIIENVKE